MTEMGGTQRASHSDRERRERVSKKVRDGDRREIEKKKEGKRE